MYPNDCLDLDYMKPQQLPHRYDSEEEDVSESEHSGHDHAYSPVESYQPPEPFDSDLSADELSNVDATELSTYPGLLSPFPSVGKASRPVSMDTLKRSSGATFVADSYIFDHDDDVIIELPSPNSTSPLHSPMFLQPTVYVPPESLPSRSPSSGSSASGSSVDDMDVLVAEQVTYVEPITKPHLIQISPGKSSMDEDDAPAPDPNPLGMSRSALKSAPFLDHEYSPKTRPRPDSLLLSARRSRQLSGRIMTQLERTTPHGADVATTSGTTIKSAVDAPPMPRPLSLHSRSMTFSRSKGGAPEKGPLSFAKNHLRRPPSLQSLRSPHFSLFPSRQAPGSREGHRSGSYSSTSSEYSPNTLCPQPYSACPNLNRDRSDSSFSGFNGPATRRPSMPMLGALKSPGGISTSSTSSLRSEVDSVYDVERNEADPQPRHKRVKSLKRSKHHKDESDPSSKKFMGFMFKSKRRSKMLNA